MTQQTLLLISGLVFLFLFFVKAIKHQISKRSTAHHQKLCEKYDIHPIISEKIREWAIDALKTDLDVDMLLAFLRHQNIYITVSLNLTSEKTTFVFFACDLDVSDTNRTILSDEKYYMYYSDALKAAVFCGMELLEKRLKNQKMGF